MHDVTQPSLFAALPPIARYGIKALFEVLRYEYSVQTQGDEFKLNNSYTSRYARMLMRQHADLDGFFETRELRAR
jgi:hypothetical protein